MIAMISTILFVDLIFITFWGGSTSLQSIFVSWITDPAAFNSNFVAITIEAAFSSIIIGASAVVATFFSGAKTDTVLFAAFASTTLYNIGKDYLTMWQIISLINPILATIIIMPFMIMFAFIVVEWLKNKD